MAKANKDLRVQVYLTEPEMKKIDKLKGDHKNAHRWAAAVIRRALK